MWKKMKFCQKNLWSGEIWLNDISFAHLMLDLIFLVTHFGTSLWLVLFSVQLSHTYCCWDHCMRCSNSGHVFLLLDSTIILLAPTGALIVTLCYYIHVQLFQIFNQSIDAIDVTSVTLSRLNSINATDVTRVIRLTFECQMSNVN